MLGVGKSYCQGLEAIVTGLVPAGNGAESIVPPRPVISSMPVSQYQRAPSGETSQRVTPVAMVTRLASSPSVCILSTSGPVALERADQAIRSPPGIGNPICRCVTFTSNELPAITDSMRARGGVVVLSRCPARRSTSTAFGSVCSAAGR